MKKILRLLSVLPAFLMLFFIFTFSAQDGDTSGSLSLRICLFVMNLCDRLFSLDLTEHALLSRAESLQLFVRKAAHITEYFLLTLSIYLPLQVWLPSNRSEDVTKHTSCKIPKKVLLLTFVLTVLCAALDEFHQSFVPGRCGTPVDVLVDSIGIIIGCILLAFLHYHIQNKRNRTAHHHSCDSPQ